jgi:hypothetical protein
MEGGWGWSRQCKVLRETMKIGGAKELKILL